METKSLIKSNSSYSSQVPAEQLLREARIVYIESSYLERLVSSATQILGRRGLVTRKLGYRTPSRLNRILNGRIGMAFSKFLTLCEITGIPLNEAIPYIYAIALYGNTPKKNLSGRPKNKPRAKTITEKVRLLESNTSFHPLE